MDLVGMSALKLFLRSFMISIIIPTRNEEKILATTLAGISEYHGDKEVIVSDGKSSDRTIDIAKQYGATIVLDDGPSRKTIAGGRNAGALLAQGEFIAFMDADVSLTKPNQFFDTLLAYLHSHPEVVGCSTSVRVLPEMETFFDKLIFSTLNGWHYILNNILGFGVTCGEFSIVRRSAFDKIGGFNESLVASEDYDFFHRLSLVGKTHFNSELCVHHTGRRAHKVGWPKLLFIWNMNAISMILLKRSMSKEWTEIR